MAQAIAKRVDALEVSHGIGGGGCPDCGGLPDESDPGNTFEIVFVAPEEAGENEWCAKCGNQTNAVIRFGDDAA
jgi:hypothetical protein